MQTFAERTAKREELLSQVFGITPASGGRRPPQPSAEHLNVLLDVIFGEVWSRPGLEPKERSMCTKDVREFDTADPSLYAPGNWL
ncbi:MAG: hypothetical protein IIC80_08495 [Chloroflexi bacterium]|nr:hypothetical protein [Chloroflexota bacterium]